MEPPGTPSMGCPICNGFETLEAICPHCGDRLDDHGRLFDLWADYSPYRPIEDLKQTDGFFHTTNQQCPHTLFCQNCGHEEVSMILEVPI